MHTHAHIHTHTRTHTKKAAFRDNPGCTARDFQEALSLVLGSKVKKIHIIALKRDPEPSVTKAVAVFDLEAPVVCRICFSEKNGH